MLRFASRVERNELCMLYAFIWASWFYRNKHIFEAQTLDGVMVASNFLKMVEKYVSYATHVFHPRVGSGVSSTSWLSPTMGCLKVNFDAHVSGNGEVGMGVVVRNSDGKVVFLATKCVVAKCEAMLAEAMTARYVVEVTARFGYDNLVFEDDASAVVKTVKNEVVGVVSIF